MNSELFADRQEKGDIGCSAEEEGEVIPKTNQNKNSIA